MSSGRNFRQAREYQICVRCVMDTTDPDIKFDEQGVCNHCTSFQNRLSASGYTPGVSEKEWESYVEVIKQKGRGKKYDCIVGVSGGVDSCYVAVLCKNYGLRPLLMHMDNGWDTEIAVNNIKELAKNLGLDYYSYVLDCEEFREIQLAFLKASSVDLEMPTDVAILASIYEMAAKYDIQYIISGGNLSSEGILPLHWGYHGHKVMRMYNHIVRKYSSKRLRKVPAVGLIKESYYRFVKRIKTLYILNYVGYNKDEAKQFLMDRMGWKDYGGKHHESKITAFWQGYAMFSKFGIDYRKAILSSQVCLGQVTRDQALEILNTPAFDELKVDADKAYIAKKYGISVSDLDKYISDPPRSYVDFPNQKGLIDFCYNIYNRFFNNKRV
jgi:N-acetyl sugar amidotransferase